MQNASSASSEGYLLEESSISVIVVLASWQIDVRFGVHSRCCQVHHQNKYHLQEVPLILHVRGGISVICNSSRLADVSVT